MGEEIKFELDKIIDRVLDNPRNFYIKLANVLTPQEREYLTQMILDKSCYNCSNGSCRVESDEKTKEESCIAWENYEMIGRQLILNNNQGARKLKQ